MLTTLIIVLTTIISIAAFQSPALMNRLIFDQFTINTKKEYFRFITSGLLHGSWVHLIINMLVLYSLGQAVEYYFSELFGSKAHFYFLLLYVGALITSDIPTFNKHKNNVLYKGLGASGAVSAIVFSSILFNPLAKIYIWGIIGIPGIVLGIIYLVYSVKMSKQSADNINHDAHFYGAVFGFLFTLILKPTLAIHFINELLSWL